MGVSRVNVNISRRIHFRGFDKMGKFASIRINVLNNFCTFVHIFADIEDTRIMQYTVYGIVHLGHRFISCENLILPLI